MKLLSICLNVGILLVLVNVNFGAQLKRKTIYKRPLDNYYDNFIYACDQSGKDPICECENEVLNCEKQDLTTTDVFVGAFNAKTANFKNNNIKTLKYGGIIPGNHYQIEVIDFSNNFISKIENNSFNSFTNLKALYLTANRLTTISSGFLTYKLGNSLHQLYLDGNQIIRIPSAFSYLRNLKKLVLDGNFGLKLNGQTFPAALGNLEILSLDGCDISDLDDGVFKRLISLKQLSLRNNPITYVPKAINGIPNLFGLDLSGTEITEFRTDVISADHKLTEIYVSNMKYLYGIYDCAFCGLPNLKKVVMSNNSQLYYINENAFGSIKNEKDSKFSVAALKVFDIHGCNFSFLPEKLFDWTKIEVLNIYGNPFNCNSDLEWLTKNKCIHFETNPKCAKPESLKGVYFSNITTRASYPSTSTTNSTPRKSASEILNGFCSMKGLIALSLTVIGFIGIIASACILCKARRANGTNGIHRLEATVPNSYIILPTKE